MQHQMHVYCTGAGFQPYWNASYAKKHEMITLLPYTYNEKKSFSESLVPASFSRRIHREHLLDEKQRLIDICHICVISFLLAMNDVDFTVVHPLHSIDMCSVRKFFSLTRTETFPPLRSPHSPSCQTL